MLIVPYSTALRLAKPPVVTLLTTLVCVLVFWFQIRSNLTPSLLYFPDSWNPLKMITSSLAHANWEHLLGNLLFYLAFAPALEVLLGNRIKYIWIMVVVSFAVGICYSVSTLIGASRPLPSLGFSGVVMGMIGLSAYLMPRARIRVLWWYGIGWKTLYVQTWILAVLFIGLDTWTMLTADDYGYINVVAHVSGGFAGYLYGLFFLSDRRAEVDEELAREIEAMNIERLHGETQAAAFRFQQRIDQAEAHRNETRNVDKFLREVYRLVDADLDSEAIVALLERYDLDSHVLELEQLFERVAGWGHTRTLLCVGRLVIEKLDRERTPEDAIAYIEKCQQVSPLFVVPDVTRLLDFAEIASFRGKADVARNLLVDAPKRYGSLVDAEECRVMLERLEEGRG